MEQQEIKQESTDKKKSLWFLGLVGLTIYSLGYIAGAKETEKIMTNSYNRGVIDSFQTIIFK